MLFIFLSALCLFVFDTFMSIIEFCWTKIKYWIQLFKYSLSAKGVYDGKMSNECFCLSIKPESTAFFSVV